MLGYLTQSLAKVKDFVGKDFGVGPMRSRHWRWLILMTALLQSCLGATFAANQVLASPRPKLPLTGTLIFHRYSSYKAWNATLWSLDLKSGHLAQVGTTWKKVISPINAQVDSSGKLMTFMASTAGLSAPEWDVFTSRWDGKQWLEPLNLTGPNGKRDEDPKFSPDGGQIIYKEDGVLTLMTNSGAKKKYLTKGEPESSMPFFRAGGEEILFERAGDILLWKKGATRVMKPGKGVSSYYPIGADDKRFLYTRTQSSRHDWIYWGSYDGSASQPLFFNSDSWDSSDPYPYQDGKKFIFLVSGDYSILKGGYNLMVADLAKAKNYNIDDLYGKVNSDLEELGPSWTKFSYN